MIRWILLGGAAVMAGVIVALLVGCAHIFPSGCQRGEQRQDPDHRVWGTADCFVCLDSPPGTVDQGNRYRCTDYTCNECEAPPVSFGTKPIILGACFPPREWVLNHWSPEGSTDGGTYYYDCREVDGGAR